MTEWTFTFSTGTLDAWMRLPKLVRLASAIVVAIAITWFGAAAIHTPAGSPAIAAAAAGPAPMRDASVPDAAQALSADERKQQEAWTPTF